MFQRDWFIKKTASLVLAKNASEEDRSHYWRAPFGAGKTVFLKLIGRELQKRGCDVYMTNSMSTFHVDYFPKLAIEAGDKTVVLMVDELQNNWTSYHWNRLLKQSKPDNLIVLGVGRNLLVGDSPPYKKHPEDGGVLPLFLTIDDLPEVCTHFVGMRLQSEETTTMVCERLLEYTAGHLFAFVKFTEHVLDPRSGIDLKNLDSYLVSENFNESTVYQRVKSRCYRFTGNMLDVAQKVQLNTDSYGDRFELEYQGHWSRRVGLASPLVHALMFSMCILYRSSSAKFLDDSEAPVTAEEESMCAGLHHMTDASFLNAHYDFEWGHNVARIQRNVWIAPQVRTKNTDYNTHGPKQSIDYFSIGRLNLGIALALDQNAAGLREHLERLDKNYGSFQQTGVLLHLQTKNEDPITDLTAPFDTAEARNRVYTFSKMKNALYRGNTLVRTNVRHLSSPNTRSYSTYVVSCMRRAVMVLK